MDRFWRPLFPSVDHPLQQRIRLLGGMMVGVTLATTLTAVLLEGPRLWRDEAVFSFIVAILTRIGGCAVLAGVSVGPFVVGAHAGVQTGRPRLLFGACLVVFFVGLAIRAFLFFDHVDARTQGKPGPEGALAALIGEPVASTVVVALLWVVLRRRA
jgi:hypothetical protein